jgi:hypothetical protein
VSSFGGGDDEELAFRDADEVTGDR